MKEKADTRWFAVMAVLILTLCMVSSCGYHLRGRGSSLPDYIKNIYLPFFQNDSIRYGLETIVTEQVKREIINFGYKIVNDKNDADAELIGTITSYRTVNERIDRGAKTETVRIYITVKVIFTDLHKESVLYEIPGLTSPSVSFDIPEDPQERNILEEEKIEDAAEELADQLVQEIFTGF